MSNARDIFCHRLSICFFFQHTGAELMLDHIFTINADKYTAVDEDGLVTGIMFFISK